MLTRFGTVEQVSFLFFEDMNRFFTANERAVSASISFDTENAQNERYG
jgi:hypothetical protein